MTKSELIQKWKNELELYKRVLNDPLMYTKEDRLKSSGKALTIVSMLVDIDELESLEQLSPESCSKLEYNGGLLSSGGDKIKTNF